MRSLLYATIWFLTCVECLHGELFTSNAHLQIAVHAEKHIADILNSYVEREQAILDKIKQLADNYASHSQRVLTSPDMSLDNPVNAFLFIKRFSVDWNRDVRPVLQSNNSMKSLRKDIKSVRSNLPTYQDLKGAAAALLRIQDTYLLDVATVASGNLNGFKSQQLSSDDCFELGKILYKNNDFEHSKLWMQHALNEKEKMRDDIEKDKEMVNRSLRLSEVHKDRETMLAYIDFSRNKIAALKKELELENRKPVDFDIRRIENIHAYKALCRGEHIKRIKDAHKLTCQYRHSHHPLLLLSPAKEETLHFQPRIVVFHDIISDDEIRQLKNFTTQYLARSTVRVPTGDGETAYYRTSKDTGLDIWDHRFVPKFTRRIEALTGLDMDTAEEVLQITNYGLGGHYDPHVDYFSESYQRDIGNRIATFMTYLNDVEAGGATVFTKLGLTVYPKKGAALFWYNMYKSGHVDPRTLHAGCPVLVGNKWIATQWIGERGQVFRRPCDTYDDTYVV